jgi:hypothetical protein
VTVQRRPHSRLASTSRLSIAAALANTKPYPQGSLFTVLSTDKDARRAASHWAWRKMAQADVRVVTMTVPNWVLDSLKKNGFYKFNSNVFPDQHIFHPDALPILNQLSVFDLITPEF